jgi:hypothetical protein
MNGPVTVWVIQVPNPVPAKKINGELYAVIVKQSWGGSIVAKIPDDHSKPMRGPTYQYIEIPEDWKPDQVPFWIPDCRNICGYDLNRFHEPCLGRCRIRLVLKGKYPSFAPVKIWQLYRREGRPHARVKDFFLNLFWRFCLRLAN